MAAENFWRFREAGDEPELLLYGEIVSSSWDDELTPALFANDLAKFAGKDLTVRINSPGGDVFAAQALYSLLKEYPGKVTARIDGICASAATIVASAGDKIIMPRNTVYMVHNPMTFLFGQYDAGYLSQIGERLNTVRQTIVNVYKDRVGDRLTEDEVIERMDAETWMTADTAKKYGFIDEVVEDIPMTDREESGAIIVNSVACKLSGFQNADGLKAILNMGSKEKRSDHQMSENELLQKIKNVLSAVRQPEAPAEQEVENSVDPVQAAVEAERQRVSALDALKTGSPIVDSLVEAGKKNGATAESLKPYIDALPEEKPAGLSEQEQALAAIRAIIADNAGSGAAEVAPTPKAVPDDGAADREAGIGDIVNFANQIRGVK